VLRFEAGACSEHWADARILPTRKQTPNNRALPQRRINDSAHLNFTISYPNRSRVKGGRERDG